MNQQIKDDTKRAVRMAVRYWPNAHLGDISPRDDVKSAFRMIRARLSDGWSVQAAIGAVEDDAYRHANM